MPIVVLSPLPATTPRGEPEKPGKPTPVPRAKVGKVPSLAKALVSEAKEAGLTGKKLPPKANTCEESGHPDPPVKDHSLEQPRAAEATPRVASPKPVEEPPSEDIDPPDVEESLIQKHINDFDHGLTVPSADA